MTCTTVPGVRYFILSCAQQAAAGSVTLFIFIIFTLPLTLGTFITALYVSLGIWNPGIHVYTFDIESYISLSNENPLIILSIGNSVRFLIDSSFRILFVFVF